MKPRALAGLLLLGPFAQAGAALDIRIEIGEVQHAALPAPLRELQLTCQLGTRASNSRVQARCSEGRLQAMQGAAPIRARFDASLSNTAAWRVQVEQLRSPLLALDGVIDGNGASLSADLRAQIADLSPWPTLLASFFGALPQPELQGAATATVRAARTDGRGTISAVIELKDLSLSEPSGRYATEKLGTQIDLDGDWNAGQLNAQLAFTADAGQVYAEPVFIDTGATPLSGSAGLRLDRASGEWAAEAIQFAQRDVLTLDGSASRAKDGIAADLSVTLPALGPAFTTYAQPFLAGTRFETLAPSGAARGRLQVQAGKPQLLSLSLDKALIGIPSFDAALTGIDGRLEWRAQGPALASTLRWSGARIARLQLGASELDFTAVDRDLRLDAPLRIPMAGGALRVIELDLRGLATPALSARFDAEVEPIDLAQLTRALGWPVFGGQLAGRLPGLEFRDRELSLGGALTAQAFDGAISVDGLRVLDPLGRVPRVMANLHLRGIDLAQLTGAFSFGRIEGRLDGDVNALRLVNWQPVAFEARLATPPGDRSRKRISQRAIDNISSIGGGPTGVLSRGAMRFFEDFAYARIGWSCVLRDGVCHMDGIKPADDGGYVLVEGRLLPRIDVVGFQRRVDWNTFLSQLKSASASQGVEVR